MIEYVHGDIFRSTETLIVHGCNCFNSFGAGIALQVFNYYKKAWMEDQLTWKGARDKMGTITYAEEDHHFIRGRKVTIVNAYTQYKYTSYEVDVDYAALDLAVRATCRAFPNHTIAMPKIGCGLAGGNWSTVTEILQEIGLDYGHRFKVYIYP